MWSSKSERITMTTLGGPAESGTLATNSTLNGRLLLRRAPQAHSVHSKVIEADNDLLSAPRVTTDVGGLLKNTTTTTTTTTTPCCNQELHDELAPRETNSETCGKEKELVACDRLVIGRLGSTANNGAGRCVGGIVGQFARKRARPISGLSVATILLLYAINLCSMGHSLGFGSQRPQQQQHRITRRLLQAAMSPSANNMTHSHSQEHFGLLGSARQLSSTSSSSGNQIDLAPTQPQLSADEERAAVHWSLPNRPSLFSIIRFPNEECFDSSNQSGTCYTAFECKLLGGQPSSPCAAGFGSCCIVSRTCHVTTREKVVYFKNPSYPSADSDEKFCDLTVEMSDISVCQLRLDFLDFQLDPPSNGACKDDYMEISASGMPPQTVPRLCGMNRNQHLGDHRWQVKVTQIDCNQYRPLDWKRHYAKFASSPLWNAHPVSNGGIRLPLGGGTGKYSTTFASGFQTMSQTATALAYEFLKPQFTPRAPMGCLQYFTQPSGIIESFNFGQYLNNMDYSICIQRQPDTCRVVFTSSDYDWSLNGVGVSGSSSGVGDQDCARDYLLIPGASRTGDGFTYDRYCGGRLNYYRGQALSAPVVIKTSGPIVLRFHSDAHFESVNNGGFRLQYDQSAQDCIYHTAEEAGSLASQQLIASTLSDSRPLGPFTQDAPALYASQQLGTGPIISSQHHHIQLQPHTDYRLDESQSQSQHQQQQVDGSSGESGAANSESIKPIRQLQSSSSLLANGGESLNLLQAAPSSGQGNSNNNNNNRRSDLGDEDVPVGPNYGPSGGLHKSEQLGNYHQLEPISAAAGKPTIKSGQSNLSPLGDLSKAFQLITARSSRALAAGSGGGRKLSAGWSARSAHWIQ